MHNGNQGFGGTRWRSLLVAAVATVGTLWASAAMATITQGDFSVFGFFETRESGQWGEGSSSKDPSPPTYYSPTVTSKFVYPGQAYGMTGGSFDFNHWDLAEARQLADVRPDYHMIKNYKLLGRFDTLLIKDADFFAYYRPWYDAYGSIKDEGRQEPNTDAVPYTSRNLQQQYFKNDLREWYAQLNFTDNFSARIGKQQVIWTEADALSGTEVTNPVNATWHGVYGAETPEDTRTNVRMIKLNYILPDFYKTANNELEGFIIPGDFQGAGTAVQEDPRNPWVAPVSLYGGCPITTCGFNAPDTPFPVNINQNGQSLNGSELPNIGGVNAAQSMIWLPIGPTVYPPGKTKGRAYGQFYDFITESISRTPSNSLENSEFGARYSTLLPIGNGLQASFIYLYEFRGARASACTNCGLGITGIPGTVKVGAGIFVAPSLVRTPAPGVPVGGTVFDVSETDYRRNNFFGSTGTYYDKDLTDIVYRYDVLYQPDQVVGVPSSVSPTGSAWTQMTRWIIAGDRPTYIPWLSKQHTFLTAQYTLTWYPDRPTGATPVSPQGGKVREISNIAFLNATNWLMNGQLTASNLFLWDIDDNVGELATTNVYRYSRNILLGLNAEWFLGRSGRFTDPYLLSREQRFNELEFTFTYEI
jgi:hypothetical protein